MSKNKFQEEIKKENPMKQIKIYSLILNICVGSSEEKLNGAVKILKKLTGQNPSLRKAKKTIKEFKIKKGEPIACITTVRGKKAEKLLEKLFEAVNKKIKLTSFSLFGNFSFGINSYIDIPGMSYDPSIGILGMDVCVNLARAGLRVQYRKRRRAKIGKYHKVTRDEAINFIKEKYKVEIV